VLGVVRAGEADFVLADVPGLIPGAAAGKGLGHRFLRHVTRSAVLVHVLDLAPLEPGRGPEEDLAALEAELAAYDPELAARPALVAANKVDLPDGRARLPDAEAAAAKRDLELYPISAATGEGVPALLRAIGAAVAATREAAPLPGAVSAVVEEPEVPISVVADGPGRYRVVGDRPVRWVAMTDMTNDDAVAFLQRRLKRAGVDDLLLAEGVSDGDEVSIADFSFEYQPETPKPPVELG
jgi:GTP-binding protein